MSRALSLLKVDGRNIVDERGKPVYLRGVNLGGWLMMEGYILHGRNFAEHIFKKEFARHNGRKELENFVRLYRQNFITPGDIRRIKELGANCLRVPFNYRLIDNDAGWVYLDKVIKWCSAEGLFCILDMHAAPGAQNPDWHSDSDGRALFWQKPRLQRHYLTLWRRLGQRYRDQTAVAGYDLLNEPIVKSPQDLRRFYSRAIRAIRSVDEKHIIFLEPNLWAQQLKSLGRPEDKNTAYSIHTYQPLNFTFNFHPHLRYPGYIDGRYWDGRRLYTALLTFYHLAEKWQVPVYVGEFGVNFRVQKYYGELAWLRDILECFRKFGFHWSYWTYKAVAGGIYPDGIYQYLPNGPWIKREGPIQGWENFYHLWKQKKKQIVSSWRTERFRQNRYITQVLSGYF